ncbi:MAG: hypothetical protein ACJ74C_08195 [Gaiellaceae bacterium]
MRALAVALVAVALLALPVGAGATIVPQQGMAGVRLQMTKAQVRAKLGAPRNMRDGMNDFGPYSMWVYPRITINFQGRQTVSSMQTLSPLERTASGVGVGSIEARVKAGVPKVKCSSELGLRHCVVGAFKPGRTVTVFSIKSGKVRAVVVGVILD